MENLIKQQTLLFLLFVSCAIIQVSCKKDDNTAEGDKTTLTALIASSDQLADTATTADYPQVVIDAFKDSLQSVKTAAATSLTQVQIDELITRLTAARNTLESYFLLGSLITNAEILSDAATPAGYPQTAIDSFVYALQTVKTAGGALLTKAEIDELISKLTIAVNTLNSYGSVAYAQLYALITEGETLLNSATFTTYPQTAIDNFSSTLQTIKTAAAALLTESHINNLITQLAEATNTFESQQNNLIDESLYLNAGWHFDEGTGTTATAFSTVQHIASFKPGNSVLLGAEALSPVWVAGVKGGNAVYLNKGAHLEVPFTTGFLPADLSISVWIKPDELFENNYIVSQNYWTGYKLQTQGGGKPFFTYEKVDGGIVDADNELNNCVKAGQWNHIVVALNSSAKKLEFFINGVSTKIWTEGTKGIGPITQTLTTPAPQPFIIGCMATDAEIEASFMDWINTDNFGYFRGVIDELKIYNIPLTGKQVSQIYKTEKP